LIPRHILAAIDFDETSDHALDAAADLARALGASLTLVHTVDIPPDAYANFGAALPPPDVLAALERHAHEELQRRLERVRAAVPETRAVLATGVPWR
jgi:nucleotide-binding universal stress UspA family protein